MDKVRKSLLVLFVLVCCILISSVPALAGYNHAEQEQYGNGDYVSIEQDGNWNSAYQWQDYYNQTNGGNNISNIYQRGDQNTASQVQEGTNNQTSITQIGNNNYAGNVDWAGQWQSGDSYGTSWTNMAIGTLPLYIRRAILIELVRQLLVIIIRHISLK